MRDIPRNLLSIATLLAPCIHAWVPPQMNFNVDKGFNILETATKLIPQGQIVSTVKETWKFAWTRMMAELAPQDKTGSYTRPSYSFNNKIGDAQFPDEPGRYHLYVGNPCPWCHRARLSIALRQITPNEIGQTILIDNAERATRGGWIFDKTKKQHSDPIYNAKDLHELYTRLEPGFEGRCTAPLLVDKRAKKIVSNESSDIVRMLSLSQFGSSLKRRELYPADQASEIDSAYDWIYTQINNGVYRCGFSTKQSAYDTASSNVRKGLEKVNAILSTQPFVCGEDFTEADLILLPTILRYDTVYSPLFRAGGVHLKIKSDFPHVQKWLQRCWDLDDGVIRDTIDLQDAAASYYRQLFPLNAGGLVPTSMGSVKEIGLVNN